MNLPDKLYDFCNYKQGFILITGPCSHGKSTTLASMIEHINMHQAKHIITIEDPIEYLFNQKESIVSQRELGRDTTSFAKALKATLREDPDVIMVGEMRDKETIETAITAAETGHLVFLWKLEEAIDTFNYYKVDFVQSLGDIINSQWVSFDSIMPLYDKLNPGIESFHLLGNHDFAVDSLDMPGLLEVLHMKDHYYSYVKKNWRFIVLNSMDYSFLANPL